jgi:hypothetical protein
MQGSDMAAQSSFLKVLTKPGGCGKPIGTARDDGATVSFAQQECCFSALIVPCGRQEYGQHKLNRLSGKDIPGI